MRFLAILLAFIAGLSLSGATDPQVNLGYANYSGTTLLNGVNTFLGMRYAAPPIMSRRFRVPEPPLKEEELIHANASGPICPGVQGLAFPPTPLPSSEDCLFIDVYAPSNASEHQNGLPVMIWLQGGAFVQLFNPNYNGTGLIEASRGNAIVVSFNYRVGAYGFLASKELQKEGNLNIGLHDQRAAIAWVQTHIHHFGGDPDRVTLFGTSIGGGSVLLQTLAYGGNPPDDRARWRAGIAQSVNIPSVFKVKDLEFQYEHLLASTNCSDLACLRSLTSETIQAANIGKPWPGQSNIPLFPSWPVIDDILFTAQPLEMLRAGNFSKDHPLLIGSSYTEGTVFVPQANTTADIASFLKTQFPSLTDKDLEHANTLYESIPQSYPGVEATESPLYYRLAKIYGDAAFSCPALTFATHLNKAGVPTHLFRTHILDETEVEAGYIVPHTWEVEAVWGPEYSTNYVALPGANSYDVGGSNRRSVNQVQRYWVNFAMTGDPNAVLERGMPAWKGFGDGARLVLQTNWTRMENVTEEELERCAFWNRVSSRTHL